MKFQNPEDTICALSTPQGAGAIALIRLSGNQTFSIIDELFSKKLSEKKSHTTHFGTITKENQIIDEVLVHIFKGPNSFTGEDTVEIACHGSTFIQNEILKLLLEKGARLAGPGEFSMRAFLNGKMDLSQTEAIADLIASNSSASHHVAMNQMRGGFAKEIATLRQSLMDFASLIELELDFSQEDVEFADRTQLQNLVAEIENKVTSLVQSFDLGNAIKNGVPVAIVGAPNAGKSTLLNQLLNEEKAIVSDIAGTTRDVIEDTIILKGIEFRFIDTAGIRETTDTIENLGIERAYDQIKKAKVVLYMIDTSEDNPTIVEQHLNQLKSTLGNDQQLFIPVLNKVDLNSGKKFDVQDAVSISAKKGVGLDDLINRLTERYHIEETEGTVVTNLRHYEILSKCVVAIKKIKIGLEQQIPGDLLAMDIREVLDLLGEITGEISSDDLLGNIFSNFCIGK